MSPSFAPGVGEMDRNRRCLCPQGAHSLTGTRTGEPAVTVQPWSPQSGLRGRPATVGFPAAVTEQNSEGGIGLHSVKTNKAKAFQMEEQADGSRSQPDGG